MKKLIAFRVQDSLNEALQAEAQRRETSASSVIRFALKTHLEAVKASKPRPAHAARS